MTKNPINNYGIIYKVINNINGKIYIGQTIKSLEHRISGHLYSGFCFHNAINKYGKENFVWEIIEHCDSKEELDEMEFHYIKQHNSLSPHGYNLTLGGDGYYGLSEESKKRRIESLKIYYEKHRGFRFGMNLSEDHKLKIGEANRGHKHSDESRKKMTASRIGRYVAQDSWRAKWYVVELNADEKYKVYSLRNFCKIYFNSIKAYKGLSAVANGKLKSYKGYKCRFYDEEKDKDVKEFIHHKDI